MLLNNVIREVLGFGVAIAAYPFGMLDEAIQHAPLRSHAIDPMRNPRYHLNPAAYDVPVVLVHGYAHNRSGFLLMRSRLRRTGFRRVYTLNYNPWLHDVAAAAGRLETAIERICAETGAPFVHIVGHSMGGIVARYYVQCMGGNERVLRVLTIGSPHAGTHAASALGFFGRTARQLAWRSPFMTMLNEAPTPGDDVWFTSIYTSGDELVIPAESARLCPVAFESENIFVPGEGHMSLLVSPKVLALVIDRLCDIEDHPKLFTVVRGGTTAAQASSA